MIRTKAARSQQPGLEVTHQASSHGQRLVRHTADDVFGRSKPAPAMIAEGGGKLTRRQGS